jgi:CTP synthase
MSKFIFVTGGVVSGLGKGITAASIGLLLKARGYKVFMQKFDPYLNVDPKNMSPAQHGEVYVTHDGAETDLDLGHYERFIDEELNYTSAITSGKIYSHVFEKERRGDYQGGTVQIVPHITNEIKNKVYEAATISKADVVITEIGGTIGDLESAAFIEALRQIKYEKKDDVLFVHTTLVPHLYGSFELKTKPTQRSVMELRGMGISPDIIVTRNPYFMDKSQKEKIALFCSVKVENIIEAVDAKNIYQIPLNFYNQELDKVILNELKMEIKPTNLEEWKNLVKLTDNLTEEIKIGIFGKYIALQDAYLSTMEALKHAGYKYNKKVSIKWLDASNKIKTSELEELDGIVIPTSVTDDIIPNLVSVLKYTRTNKIPTLTIGEGTYPMVLEYLKNICKLDVSLKEENNHNKPVIDLLDNIKTISNIPVNRLGNYEIKLKKNTKASEIYNTNKVLERHRISYEINLSYLDILNENNFIISGFEKTTGLISILELNNHPYYIGCIYQPEFKSRPNKPHPVYINFIETIIKSL